MVRQTCNLPKRKKKDPDFVASLVYILRQFLVRLFVNYKKDNDRNSRLLCFSVVNSITFVGQRIKRAVFFLFFVQLFSGTVQVCVLQTWDLSSGRMGSTTV